MRFAHRPGTVNGEVEQGVIDNMIIFQKLFPGPHQAFFGFGVLGK